MKKDEERWREMKRDEERWRETDKPSEISDIETTLQDFSVCNIHNIWEFTLIFQVIYLLKLLESLLGPNQRQSILNNRILMPAISMM